MMVALGACVLAIVAGVWLYANRATGQRDRAQPAASATPTEATRVGASSEPTFQRAEVATDPTFAEVRGRMLAEVADFPSYPGATLVGSSRQNRADQPTEGYRIKWTTRDSVSAVMSWYQQTLPAEGWRYAAPDDGAPPVEQVARISKRELSGYVSAEATGVATEVVVSLKKR